MPWDNLQDEIGDLFSQEDRKHDILEKWYSRKQLDNRGYYEINASRLKKRRMERYYANKAADAERSKSYYRANKEKQLDYQREYRRRKRAGSKCTRETSN